MSKELIQRLAACFALLAAAMGVSGCGPSTTLLAASSPAPANSSDPVSAADRAFVAMVSQGGMFEVLAGQAAVQQGNTQDLRDQGATEAHDHQIVGDKLKAICAVAGIPIADALNPQFQKQLDDLRALSGSSFDVTYLREMDEIHKKDGAAFATEAKSGANRALREFAAETRRIVQRHLGELHASGAALN
jgi:putative membrane protein